MRCRASNITGKLHPRKRTLFSYCRGSACPKPLSVFTTPQDPMSQLAGGLYPSPSPPLHVYQYHRPQRAKTDKDRHTCTQSPSACLPVVYPRPNRDLCPRKQLLHRHGHHVGGRVPNFEQLRRALVRRQLLGRLCRSISRGCRRRCRSGAHMQTLSATRGRPPSRHPIKRTLGARGAVAPACSGGSSVGGGGRQCAHRRVCPCVRSQAGMGVGKNCRWSAAVGGWGVVCDIIEVVRRGL